MNGENVEQSNGTVNIGGEPIISGILAKLLKALGLYEFVTMVAEVIKLAFSAIPGK